MFGNIHMYHRIVKNPKISINQNFPIERSIDDVEKFIKSKIKSKHKFVDLDTFLKHPHAKNIHITIDDGYADFGFELFLKYNIPFTIYISNCFLNGTVDLWWYKIEKFIENKSQTELYDNIRNDIVNKKTINEMIDQPIKDIKLLTWEELKKYSEYDICSVGCHSYDHLNLNQLNFDDAEIQIFKSKKEIENKINKKVTSFAYPYGKYCDVLISMLSQYFENAVTTDYGNYEKEDKYLLRRK